MVRRLQTIRSRRVAHIAVNTSCTEINTCSKNHLTAPIDRAGVGFYTHDPLFHRITALLLPLMLPLKGSILARDFLREDLSNLRLSDRQMIRVLQDAAHGSRVLLLVRLSTQGVDRRSLGFIQHLRLDKRFINIFAHLTAEGIQLTDKMSLGTSSDVRVAWHQGNAVHADRKHDRLKPKSRCRKRRLASRMARTDNYNIICLLYYRHFISSFLVNSLLSLLYSQRNLP